MGVFFRYLAVLTESPLAFVMLIAAFGVALLVGLVFHELAHAWVADSLGDRTPRSAGRLTLNPKRHLDPIGTPLVFVAGIGWAKPVPVNPYGTSGNVRFNAAAIASAGPITNLVVAGLAGLPIRFGWTPFHHPFVHPAYVGEWAQGWTESPGDLLGLFLGTVVLLNVLLAIFNLMPLAPLDGFHVVSSLLPRPLAARFTKLEPWGVGVLMVMIVLPFVGGPALLFDAMAPPRDFLLEILAGKTSVRAI